MKLKTAEFVGNRNQITALQARGTGLLRVRACV